MTLAKRGRPGGTLTHATVDCHQCGHTADLMVWRFRCTVCGQMKGRAWNLEAFFARPDDMTDDTYAWPQGDTPLVCDDCEEGDAT